MRSRLFAVLLQAGLLQTHGISTRPGEPGQQQLVAADDGDSVRGQLVDSAEAHIPSCPPECVLSFIIYKRTLEEVGFVNEADEADSEREYGTDDSVAQLVGMQGPTTPEHLVLCACSKCGSSSLFQWMYEVTYGKSWHSALDDGDLQLTSPEDKPMPQVLSQWPVSTHIDLAAHQRPTVMSGKEALKYSIVREPLERYASSFRSKVSCTMCDECHPEALPRDLAEMSRRIQKFAALANGPQADQEAMCLDIESFGRLLATVLHEETLAAQLDPHFLPQHLGYAYDQCAGGAQLTAAELASMAPALVRSFEMRNVSFPHSHETHADDGDADIAALAAHLCATPVLQGEYAYLGMLREYEERCGVYVSKAGSLISSMAMARTARDGDERRRGQLRAASASSAATTVTGAYAGTAGAAQRLSFAAHDVNSTGGAGFGVTDDGIVAASAADEGAPDDGGVFKPASTCERRVQTSKYVPPSTLFGKKDMPDACCDWLYAELPQWAKEEAFTADTTPPDPEKLNILSFNAVGGKLKYLVRDRLTLLKDVGVDNFVAHYDNASLGWYLSQDWYNASVDYWVNYKALFKSRYIANELLMNREFARTKLPLYSHVWLVDEDIAFPPPADVRAFLATVVRHDALIAQPAITNTTWGFLHPDGADGCRVRHTDFVEVQAPLIQTRVARGVFSSLFRPNSNSEWGVDLTWCKFAQENYGRAQQPACIVAQTGGPFVKLHTHSSSYSRDESVMSEACMRQEHKDLVAAPRMLSCLSHSLEPELLGQSKALAAATSAPAAAAALNASSVQLANSTGRRLRMYVYKLSKRLRKCDRPIPDYSPASNFEYENFIEFELAALTEPTDDPSQADLYLLPACLVQAWEEHWVWENGRLSSSCLTCLSAHETELLQHMRSVGPYFDQHPERHLLSRHMCPHTGADTSRLVAAGQRVYPTLWQHPSVRYVCIETVKPAYKIPTVLDTNRAVHVPYWTNMQTLETPLPSAARQRLLGFAGSPCCGREFVQRAIGAENVHLLFDVRKFKSASKARNSSDWRSHLSLVGSSVPELRDFVRHSAFLIEPYGDTPEREQIYNALHDGTPIIFPQHVVPPLHLPDWRGVALESAVEQTKWSQELRDALVAYDDKVLSKLDFAEARKVFIWSTKPFRQQLGVVLARVFPAP